MFDEGEVMAASQYKKLDLGLGHSRIDPYVVHISNNSRLHSDYEACHHFVIIR